MGKVYVVIRNHYTIHNGLVSDYKTRSIVGVYGGENMARWAVKNYPKEVVNVEGGDTYDIEKFEII